MLLTTRTRALTSLWLGFAAVIAYGSVYPFNFQAQHLDVSAFQALLDTRYQWSGRGDILGNILLFLPFGYLGITAAEDNASLAQRLLLVTLGGAVFALILQIAQIYLPTRDQNLQDVVWNVMGIAAGAFMATRLRKHVRARAGTRSLEPMPCLLVTSWLIYRLVPFVPSVDFQMIKDSVKPLLLHPQFDAVSLLHNTSAWLVVASLLQRAQPGAYRDRLLWLLMLGVFGLEVIIVNNALTLSNVAGAALALGLWWGALRQFGGQSTLLAVLLVVTIVVQGLTPFVLQPEPQEFAWLPFKGLLGGSMYLNVQSITHKVFVYGSLVYLLWQKPLNHAGLTGVATLIVALVELGQRYVVGHTPEITDPLLVVLAAVSMRLLGGHELRSQQAAAHALLGSKGDRFALEHSRKVGEFYEETVNLRDDHLNYLNTQSSDTNEDVSAVCRTIVDSFMQSHPVATATTPVPSSTSNGAPDSSTGPMDPTSPHWHWTKQSLRLRPDQYQYVRTLSGNWAISHSRVIRRLIALAMRDNGAA